MCHVQAPFAKRGMRFGVCHEALSSFGASGLACSRSLGTGGAVSKTKQQEANMTLTPLMSAPVVIQIHVLAALLSIVLGPVVLYRPRRDRMHRRLGHVWVTAMATVALSAMLIPSFASPFHFGILHGFAVLTCVTLVIGVRSAIRRDIAGHEAAFRSLYWNGLLIAGLFTLLPGRRINEMLFGERAQLGYLVIALGAALLIRRVARGLRSGPMQA